MTHQNPYWCRLCKIFFLNMIFFSQIRYIIAIVFSSAILRKPNENVIIKLNTPKAGGYLPNLLFNSWTFDIGWKFKNPYHYHADRKTIQCLKYSHTLARLYKKLTKSNINTKLQKRTITLVIRDIFWYRLLKKKFLTDM